MILLQDDFPGPLSTGQVSFKSFLPRKEIHSSRTTGRTTEWDFSQALNTTVQWPSWNFRRSTLKRWSYSHHPTCWPLVNSHTTRYQKLV